MSVRVILVLVDRTPYLKPSMIASPISCTELDAQWLEYFITGTIRSSERSFGEESHLPLGQLTILTPIPLIKDSQGPVAPSTTPFSLLEAAMIQSGLPVSIDHTVENFAAWASSGGMGTVNHSDSLGVVQSIHLLRETQVELRYAHIYL